MTACRGTRRFPAKLRAVFGLLALCLSCGPAPAHIPTHGVGTATLVRFQVDRVLLTFDLSYDGYWAQAEMIGIDSDRNHEVDEGEAAAYLDRQWEKKISPRLRARIDGRTVPLEKLGGRHEGLVGEVFAAPFSLYYELEVPFPGGALAPGVECLFEFEDEVVRDETPAKPRFSIPYEGHGADPALRFSPKILEPPTPILEPAGYLLEGFRLRVRFRFEATGAGPAAKPPPREPIEGPSGQAPAAEQEPPEPEKPPQASRTATVAAGSLEQALERYRELRWYEILFCVLLAVLAGAGHALAPGHGKAMVAAYLIGSRGRVRDAVVLGLTTTLTHTGSVFLFGLTLFYLVSQGAAASEGALQNRIIVGTQLASGILLFGLGLTLFVRRIRGRGPHHSHSHDPSHGHSHAHPHVHAPPSAGLLRGGTPRLRDLLALGFSGGLVPCPAGLTVILVGLHFPDKLLFALFLLVFFSIGLGSVLVSIGVALISGKALLSARSREGAFFQEMGFLRRWLPLSFLSSLDSLGAKGLRVLPALSGLFIAGLGVLFCITTFVTGRTEIAALLRAVADWVQGGP